VLKHDSPSNNGSLDFALAEAVATFDQFFQPPGEALCRSPIDNGVIEAQRHAEILADGDLPIDDHRFLCNAAQGNIQDMVVDRDAPAIPEARLCALCESLSGLCDVTESVIWQGIYR